MKRPILRSGFLGATLLCGLPAAFAQPTEKHAIKFDDLIHMHRVAEAQVSPDGKWVAYSVATPDLEANRSVRNIWIVATAGGAAAQLTQSGKDSSPVWSPDGKALAFLSTRDGNSQVYVLTMEGGEAREVTHLSTGADLLKWSGDATPRDLTAGANYDVPPDERGGPEDFNFSPDGKEICFTAVTDKVEAISTNGDLFLVPVTGGEPKNITLANPGFDGNPVYSPDGRYIAYHAQRTPEYESDRWRVMLYDRQSGKNENLSEGFDRSANELAWSADSKTIYFTAENETLQLIYAMAARAGAEPKTIIAESHNAAISLSGDSKTLAFERSSLTMPAEIFAAASDGSGVRQLTHHNDAILAALNMNVPETFWFEGAGKTRVQAMLIRPPDFDATKKYPLVVVLHGGPQTMSSNAWGYRWNPQVFSAPGYVTLMINRRGSTGYGQKFTDEITNDWGGKAYADVMNGVEYTLAKYPFVDGKRMAAVGGSYGGYMANWIATHSGQFKAIISHAGIYDKASMYATEELWFEEHDMQGMPWTNPESYRKWAPMTYASELGKFKTPTLVIAGERDYRVPYTQSLEFFNALQRQNVPSKLVVFPDEGHWILKPQNSQFWYKTFLDWLATYLK